MFVDTTCWYKYAHKYFTLNMNRILHVKTNIFRLLDRESRNFGWVRLAFLTRCMEKSRYFRGVRFFCLAGWDNLHECFPQTIFPHLRHCQNNQLLVLSHVVMIGTLKWMKLNENFSFCFIQALFLYDRKKFCGRIMLCSVVVVVVVVVRL